MDFIVNNDKYRQKDLHIKDIRDDINWIYEKVRLKNKPKFILIAQSSKEEKLMVNYFFNVIRHESPYYCKASELIFKRVVDKIHKQIRSKLKKIYLIISAIFIV